MASEIDIEELRKGLEGVTPGPWWSDSERGDQFDAYAVYFEPKYLDGKPSSICDTHNAGAIELEQEDGRPWDEQGRKNMAHIARCSPEVIRALLDRDEALIKALKDAVPFVASIRTVAAHEMVADMRSALALHSKATQGKPNV